MRYLNKELLTQNIRQTVTADVADGKVGGAGLCVMQNGQEVFKQYFGKRSAASPDIRDNAEGDRLIFRQASMTKPVTTLAALMQVSRGKLDLHAPITKWLPNFAEMDIGQPGEQGKVVRVGKATHTLTLEMLLNHTSGLGSCEVGAFEQNRMTATDRHDLAHVVDFLSGSALAFEPTTKESYSWAAGFDTAARLVELTADMPFDEFVRKNITDPCGMPDTTFTPTAEQWSRFITMHNRVEGKNGAPGVSVDDCGGIAPGCIFGDFPITWFCGGAGLASSLPDYVRFAEMLCRGGVTADGQRLIPAEYIRAMGTPTVSEAVMPGCQKWGLGVRVICGPCHMPEHCFGWSGAYGSHFWVDPDNQITAVYMKNSCYDGGAGSRTSVLFEQDVYKSFAD